MATARAGRAAWMPTPSPCCTASAMTGGQPPSSPHPSHPPPPGSHPALTPPSLQLVRQVLHPGGLQEREAGGQRRALLGRCAHHRAPLGGTGGRGEAPPDWAPSDWAPLLSTFLAHPGARDPHCTPPIGHLPQLGIPMGHHGARDPHLGNTQRLAPPGWEPPVGHPQAGDPSPGGRARSEGAALGGALGQPGVSGAAVGGGMGPH